MMLRVSNEVLKAQVKGFEALHKWHHDIMFDLVVEKVRKSLETEKALEEAKEKIPGA